MDKSDTSMHHVEMYQPQGNAIEGQLEKKFSKLTMIGMAFAILK